MGMGQLAWGTEKPDGWGNGELRHHGTWPSAVWGGLIRGKRGGCACGGRDAHMVFLLR